MATQHYEKKTWQEFTDAGFLWFANRILHVFGWAIVVAEEEDSATTAYPARTDYRGFPEGTEEEGYIKVTRYMRDNVKKLLAEICDPTL